MKLKLLQKITTMKKINLKMFAFAAIASLAFSSCAVHNREYNRRPPRHDRDRDHRDHRDHDDRHRDDHY